MSFVFFAKKVECCSLELYWSHKIEKEDSDDTYEYILRLKEEGGEFETFYNGNETFFEVINLKPNKEYTFKLKIFKNKIKIPSKIINIKTLKAPRAILSENSFKIQNGENINSENSKWGKY